MKKAISFRFSEEFVELIRTWAFAEGKEQREVIEEAVREYMDQRPEMKEKVKKIIETMKEK